MANKSTDGKDKGTATGPGAPGAPEGPKDEARSKAAFHAFSRILDGIYDRVDAPEINRRVLETALELIGGSFGFIGELNVEGNFQASALGGLIWRSGNEPSEDDLVYFANIPLEGVWKGVIREGEPFLENNMDKASVDRMLIGLPAGTTELKHFMAVPYLVMGRVMGMLAVANKKGGFVKEDLDTLTELANLVSMGRSRTMALDAAITSTSEGIALVDRNGVLSMVNPAMGRMFKYKTSEIEGRSLLGLFMDPITGSPMGEAIAGAVMDGSWTGEAVSLRRDGARFPVHLSITSLDEELSPKAGFLAIIRDISAEKQAEGRAELYFETAEVMLLALDMDGNVTMINRKGEEVLGRDRNELLGEGWFATCVDEHHRRDAWHVVEAIMEGDGGEGPVLNGIGGWANGANGADGTDDGDVLPIEGHVYPIVDKDGHRRTIQWRYSLIRNPKGLVTGILASGNDITERKRAEEDLRRSEAFYKGLIMASPDAVIVSDLEGNIIEVSEQALKMYGTDDPKEIIGKPSFEYIVPEDREKALKGMEKVFAEGSVKGIEYRLFRKDGTIYRARLNVTIITDADGNPTSFLGIMRDVEEEWQAVERLKEAEEKYRSMVDNSPLSLVRICVEDQKVIHANEVAASNLGYATVEEMLENYDALSSYPAEKGEEFMEELLRTGKVTNFRIDIASKDGAVVHTMINAGIDETKRYIDVAGINITKLVQTEKRLMDSERAYGSVFEDSRIGIVRTSIHERRILMANRAAAELMGYDSVEEFIRVDPMDLYAPELRDVFLKEVFRNGKVTDHEIELMRKDGTRLCALMNAKLNEEEGHIDVIALDITAMKDMEKKLKVAEESYGLMFRSSTMGMARVGLEHGNILLTNEAFARAFGYTSADDAVSALKMADHVVDGAEWDKAVGLDKDGNGPPFGSGPLGQKEGFMMVMFVPQTRLRFKKKDGREMDLFISGVIHLGPGYMDLTFIDPSILGK